MRAKVPESESSRERIGQGPTGTFASESELAWGEKAVIRLWFGRKMTQKKLTWL